MLSSGLNSRRAIDVIIHIVRTFVKLQEMMSSHKHKDLACKPAELVMKYGGQFQIVFEAKKQLMAQPELKEKKIGFIIES